MTSLLNFLIMLASAPPIFKRSNNWTRGSKSANVRRQNKKKSTIQFVAVVAWKLLQGIFDRTVELERDDTKKTFAAFSCQPQGSVYRETRRQAKCQKAIMHKLTLKANDKEVYILCSSNVIACHDSLKTIKLKI